MKKIVVLAISLFLITGILNGCKQNVNYKFDSVFDSVNEYGNNSTNLNNRSHTAQQGNWIITSIQESKFGNYSLRLISLTSGESYILKEDKLLRQDELGFFNISIVGDNVYYTTASVWGSLFKFHKYNINTKEDIVIFKSNTTSIPVIETYMATQDYVFYVTGDKENEYYLRRYDVVTGENEVISKGNYSSTCKPAFSDNDMYYVNENCVYVLCLDDTSQRPVKLYENVEEYDINYISVYEDNLYITDGNTIFCYDCNKKELYEILSDKNITYIWALDDKLIYDSSDESYKPYYLSAFDLSTQTSKTVFEFKEESSNVSVFDDIFVVESYSSKNIGEIEIYSLSGELLKTYSED